jgi:hypothetical protein
MVKTVSGRAMRMIEEDIAISNEANKHVAEEGIGEGFDVSAAVEKINRPTPSGRAEGLHALITFMRSYNITSVSRVDSFEQTISARLVELLEGTNSSMEKRLCCKLAKLLALSVGAGSDDFFGRFELPLHQLAADENCAADEDLRRYALFTLSFVSFVCKSEPNNDLWLLCEKIMSDASDEVPYSLGLKATAAECWLLLATIVPRETVMEHSRECVFVAMKDALEAIYSDPAAVTGSSLSDADVEVVLTTGIAFLFEVADSLTPRHAEQTAALLCKDAHAVYEASNMVVAVARAHEDRAEFSAAEDFLLYGTRLSGEERVVPLHDGEARIDSFRSVIVLEALSKVMGTGLLNVVRLYPVVRDILRLEEVHGHMGEVWRDEAAAAAVREAIMPPQSRHAKAHGVVF